MLPAILALLGLGFVCAVARCLRFNLRARQMEHRWVKPFPHRFELYRERAAFLFLIDLTQPKSLSIKLIPQVVKLLDSLKMPYGIYAIPDDYIGFEYGVAALPALIFLADGVPCGYVRADKNGKGLTLSQIHQFTKGVLAEWEAASGTRSSSGRLA